jgi:predicted GIY-YIG superfamily endonuclease
MHTEYFIYVIESVSDGIWYIGLSSDPKSRLKQHNAGKSKFTKGHLPWILIYTEKAGDLPEARKMEKYYKTAAGKRRLKKILGLS